MDWISRTALKKQEMAETQARWSFDQTLRENSGGNYHARGPRGLRFSVKFLRYRVTRNDFGLIFRVKTFVQISRTILG
jgi:hypothetical protein